jgi:hypothetical protein
MIACVYACVYVYINIVDISVCVISIQNAIYTQNTFRRINAITFFFVFVVIVCYTQCAAFKFSKSTIEQITNKRRKQIFFVCFFSEQVLVLFFLSLSRSSHTFPERAKKYDVTHFVHIYFPFSNFKIRNFNTLCA